jgi:hypothetical protein
VLPRCRPCTASSLQPAASSICANCWNSRCRV